MICKCKNTKTSELATANGFFKICQQCFYPTSVRHNKNPFDGYDEVDYLDMDSVETRKFLFKLWIRVYNEGKSVGFDSGFHRGIATDPWL